jgi:hypothetical protein
MQVTPRVWTKPGGWNGSAQSPSAQLVLYFASRSAFDDAQLYKDLRAAYPSAHILGCSTAGEISGTSVLDDSCVATAINFSTTTIEVAYAQIASAEQSADAGEALARQLNPRGLVHAFVLAEGLQINGSELVLGLRRGLPSGVAVTGGLAGDGDRFHRTSVRLDDNVRDGGVAIIGFYGQNLKVGYGSMGGWDPFGPERLITRAEGNILYELDGAYALELYKKYLGEHAAELPASGLLFPISLRGADSGPGVVRTILGINENDGSLIFAGAIPQGGHARLMKANIDRLVDGAQGAAEASYQPITGEAPDLAILISCVGRKLVLKQRVEEEVESVRHHMGRSTLLTGFYSYGEIAPFSSTAKCELHNQTMTITALSERVS